MLRFVSCIFIVVTIFAARVYADQITLKNGDRITGTVVKSDGKKLTVKTDAMGEITIDWSAVQAITSGDRLHIALKNGQKLEGPVTTVDGNLQVETKSGPVTAPTS